MKKLKLDGGNKMNKEELITYKQILESKEEYTVLYMERPLLKYAPALHLLRPSLFPL